MTNRFHNALIIGKFYPPHRGHHRLINQACELAGQVWVVVMASGAETSIPLTDRVAWLRHDHRHHQVRIAGVQCEAPLDLHDETVWDAQVAAVRSALRTLDADPIDVVVSGETYGSQLASYFSAEFLHIDRDSDTISGTQIRSDLAANWDGLSSATRAGMACRVVVLGAESTGTTTITEALSTHYRQNAAPWDRTQSVGEYGRDYTQELWDIQRASSRSAGRLEPAVTDLVWQPGDFDHIGARQTELENRAAGSGSPLLLCDTDAFATAIWERRYLAATARTEPPWAQPPALPHHDLYLLTSHEGVPWLDDGIREGDLSIRAAMTDWFADALTQGGHPWVMLKGTLTQRLALALRSIEPVLRRRLTITDPLYGPGFPPPGAGEPDNQGGP